MSNYKVGFSEVCEVPLPEETKTYIPVSHEDAITRLADKLKANNFIINNANYSLSRGGNIMSFMLGADKVKEEDLQVDAYNETYSSNRSQQYLFAGLNSYDKTTRLAYASGSEVMVCHNGMISGSIHQLRKHTKNVFRDIDGMLEDVVRDAESALKYNQEFALALQVKKCTPKQSAIFLGRMVYYDKILSIHEGQKVYKEFTKDNTSFPGRDYWSLYNACTQILKKIRPDVILQKHKVVHEYFDFRLL